MTKVGRPPLLFLCHRIPYPPNKGDKIRSFHLLFHLSQHFDIYLATFIDDPLDRVWTPEVEKYCAKATFISLNSKIASLGSVTGFLTQSALSLPYYKSETMQRWVNEQVEANDINRVLVFSAVMAQYATHSSVAVDNRIIDFVDVDSEKWRQYADLKPWPKSWVYRREAELLLQYERQVAKIFDACFFVSPAEAALFSKLAPESAHKIDHFENGVDTGYFRPSSDLPNPYGIGKRALVFTGAMDYWPNIDAACWFAKTVFPLLLNKDPKLTFYVVGSNPSNSVKKLAGLPHVEITGAVKDVRPYLQHAYAAVAPMRVARGVQNKVLEAMAMKKRVLVSSSGIEGIDIQSGNQVIVANSADEYVSAVQRLKSDCSAKMGESARDHVIAHHSWSANLSDVTNHILETAKVDHRKHASA